MQPCLDKQRGSIMKRNSCQSPFTKRMDVNVRQTLVDRSGQHLTLQVDIFNFLNLLNKSWGQNRFPIASSFNNQSVLAVAAKQPGAIGDVGAVKGSQWSYSVPTAILNGVNNFNSPWTLNTNSATNNYQLQMTVRYAF
jgi:hypothetical protein